MNYRQKNLYASKNSEPRGRDLWGRAWFVLPREENAEQRSFLITSGFIRNGCRKQISIVGKLFNCNKRTQSFIKYFPVITVTKQFGRLHKEVVLSSLV